MNGIKEVSMRINSLIKQVFIIALFTFSLIPFSYVQAQESLQQAVQREKMLEAQADQSVAASQQKEAQYEQKVLEPIDRDNKIYLAQMAEIKKAEQEKARQEALQEQYRMTPAGKKKDAQDWAIYYVFEGLLLLLSIGLLVFILLLHLPNRIIGPDHPVHGLPMAIAVRRGMTQARFNASVSPLIFWEMLFIVVLVGIGFKSFLAFIIAVFVGLVLINIKTSAFVLMYLFSTFWMMATAQFGYLLCGGQFATMGNYVSAWIGGLIVAVLGFSVAFGLHTAGLQYYDDIGSQ